MKRILFATLLLIIGLNVQAATTTTNVNDGRYVIYMNPQFRGDQFVLDTQTGRCWQLVKDNNGLTLWQQLPYENLTITNGNSSFNLNTKP